MPIVRGEKMKAAEWGEGSLEGKKWTTSGEERKNRKDNRDLFYLQLNVYSQ